MKKEARDLIKRVRERLPESGVRTLISELLAVAIPALRELSDLDETIYSFFSGEDVSLLGDADELSRGLAEAVLSEVHGKTYGTTRKLSEFLRQRRLLDKTSPPPTDAPDFDLDDDFELSFQDGGPTDAPNPLAELSKADDLELDQALALIADDPTQDFQQKVESFHKQVSMLGRVLVQDIESFNTRIRSALSSGRLELAMRELDSGRSSLVEGLFALIEMVFDVFGAHVDRTDLLPTYKSALEQSLSLRRGLAELTRRITSENDRVIQDASVAPNDQQEGLVRAAADLEAFTRNDLFRSMRAPDRLEMERFLRKMRDQPLGDAKLACEGLAKYLESLSIINQREVLLQHDQQVMDGVRQQVGAARSLLLVTVAGAAELTRDALRHAEQLRGRTSACDQALDRWQANSEALETQEGLEAVLNRLEELVR